MSTHTEHDLRRRRRARNTALLLGIAVILVYFGFIAVGVLRS